MARRLIDTSISEYEEDVGPTRGDKREERKRIQEVLDAVTGRLAELTSKARATLDLDAELEASLATLAGIERGGALRRQRRHIARLLRTRDIEELTRKLDTVLGARQLEARTHRIEGWRRRLVDSGDEVLNELFAAYPHAERQPLLQLIRAARDEREKGTASRRYKELYQALKVLDAQG